MRSAVIVEPFHKLRLAFRMLFETGLFPLCSLSYAQEPLLFQESGSERMALLPERFEKMQERYTGPLEITC